MSTRITFNTQPNKSTEQNDISMEVDDNSTDMESKKSVVFPIKPPGPSTIITPEEDSGFENMDVDEPKECNFQESIRRKRPFEIVIYKYICIDIILWCTSIVFTFFRTIIKKI